MLASCPVRLECPSAAIEYGYQMHLLEQKQSCRVHSAMLTKQVMAGRGESQQSPWQSAAHWPSRATGAFKRIGCPHQDAVNTTKQRAMRNPVPSMQPISMDLHVTTSAWPSHLSCQVPHTCDVSTRQKRISHMGHTQLSGRGSLPHHCLRGCMHRRLRWLLLVLRRRHQLP